MPNRDYRYRNSVSARRPRPLQPANKGHNIIFPNRKKARHAMSKDEKKANLNIIDVRNPSLDEKPQPVEKPATEQGVEEKQVDDEDLYEDEILEPNVVQEPSAPEPGKKQPT